MIMCSTLIAAIALFKSTTGGIGAKRAGRGWSVIA
jgi:hypothetical protein